MNILVCIASNIELEKLFDYSGILTSQAINTKITSFQYKKLKIDFLVSGISGYFTTYHLLEALDKKKYNLAINMGIAGSFKKEIKPGKIVKITSEIIADLGIEDNDNFLSLFEANLMEDNIFPFFNGMLKPINDDIHLQVLDQLEPVFSITSSISHGNKTSIYKIKEKYDPDIENMEGAAFFYTCSKKKIKNFQVRAISNYVEPRNKEKWQIDIALKNLAVFFDNMLDEINSRLL